jgi:hypothetical protein
MSEEQTAVEEEEEQLVQSPVGLSPEQANRPGIQIKGQQALGVPNVVTQTGLTDPSNLEMLYDPTEFISKSEEVLDPTQTFEGSGIASQKLLDTGEDRKRLIDPDTVSDIPDVTVDPRSASQIEAENIERTFSTLPTATAAQGSIRDQDVIDPNQIVDERTKQQLLERGSLAQAKTQDLAQQATMEFQIEQLTQGLDGLRDVPPWASPTVRKINAVMQQRGLGASSMAAAALAQGLMEAAIPIAAQDAQKYATLQLQNLNNEQQTALANAATLSTMDRQNLDNRMKAAQQNAQSFLNMNLKNVSNEQQSAVLTYQSKVQSLFTDQAAENARQQFNATSENQVNQFYDQLGSTVETANRARDVAIQKFNSEEKTAVNEFNTNLDNVREQFNVAMRNQVDQANVAWRRQINTANTANENRANQINSAILLGLTTSAQNDLWQKYRDEAHQLYATTENEIQRAHQIVVTAMQNQFSTDMFDRTVDFKTQVAAGAASQGYINQALDFGMELLTSKNKEGESIAGNIVDYFLDTDDDEVIEYNPTHNYNYVGNQIIDDFGTFADPRTSIF